MAPASTPPPNPGGPTPPATPRRSRGANHGPRPLTQLRVWLLGLAAVISGATAAGLAAQWLTPWAVAAVVALTLLAATSVWLGVRSRLRPADQWRDAAPCYLSVQDRDLRIVETNALFRGDFGDRIGQHCYVAYKGRSSPCPGCPVLKTFEDAQNHTGQERVVTQQGEEIEVLVTSTPFRLDGHGRPTAVLEMSTNISTVKLLERELERNRQHFKQLFDSVPCIISLQDREFRIVETNALFRKDFGDGVGQYCFRVYKGRDTVCPDCPVERTFADGEVHSAEESVLTKDGSRAAMIVHSMPLRDERGNITSVMEVSTNITEVKRLQHELAMMGLAVAGTAHRVKNILMGLEGGIFVVNAGFEEQDNAQVNEGWEMVERNVSRIARLVKDLLYCSKERTPSYQDDVSPAEIVREVHELFRDKTARENIELLLELEPPEVRGRFDPEGLHNLVANLTANAIDACRFDTSADHPPHQITLRCRGMDQQQVMIEVADNGPGIPEDQQDKVFQGFFSTKGTEGTGLGLLVVRKVASEHGGTLDFHTDVGQGTTFRVVLSSHKEQLADGGAEQLADGGAEPDTQGAAREAAARDMA